MEASGLAEARVSRRLLTHAAERHGARVMLSGPQGDLTYAEAAAIAAGWTARMLAAGVSGRVLVAQPASAQFVLAVFALLEAGAVPVLVNPAFTPRERGEILRDCGAGWTAEAAGPQVVLRHHGGRADLVLSAARPRPEPAAPAGIADDPDADAIMFYTSGSTGRMKGVVHTLRSLLLNPLQLVRTMGIDARDTYLTSAPFFHLFGFSPGTLTAVIAGARIVVPETLGVVGVLEQVQRRSASVLVCGASLLRQAVLLARSRRCDLSSLRLVLVSGMVIPRTTVEAAMESLCPRILNLYGTTETGIIAQTTPEDPPARLATTVGRPLAGVEVRIVGDDRRTLAAPAVGEIACRTNGLFRHYLNMPEATLRARDQDGWYDTGDLGELDEGGYLTVVGRKDDMIIRSGFNVYPREIEIALLEHPAVSDCSVLGVDDPRYGQRIRAVVVRAEGREVSERTLRAHCSERLVRYKVPDEVWFVQDFPRTSMGKIDRKRLNTPAASDVQR